MRSVATLKDQFEIVLGSQYKVSGSSRELTPINVIDEKMALFILIKLGKH